MPKILASHPTFAPILTDTTASEDPIYGQGVQIANLVSVSVAEQLTLLSPLAGGQAIFNSADIALQTTGIPQKAAQLLFGMTAGNGGAHLYETAFTGIWGGFWYIEGIIDTTGLHYCLHWIRRCIFSPPPESAVSRAGNGGSVTLTNVTFNGRAYLDRTQRWRERFYFSSAEAALNALRQKSGLN